MIAWHGEESLKSAVIERLKEHRRMDRITQGIYWEDGRGCALGCLTHDNNNSHEAAERLFAIPLMIGYWIEAVFEGLPKEECGWWVVESAKAIPVGADMSLAHHHFGVWLLDENTGINTIADVNRDAIQEVRRLHLLSIQGIAVSDETWCAARSAARSAAESAAWSAAESAAWSAAGSAAWSAARSAAWSAAWSARSAAWSAAWSAAESAAWKKIADKSLEFFAACPVVEEKQSDCQECITEARAVLAQSLI